jgi:hypothetical protein
LVDQDDVPLAKSFISQRKTELPRPAASRAMPQPLIPPPMIARSKIRSKGFPRRLASSLLAIYFRFGLNHNQIRKQPENGKRARCPLSWRAYLNAHSGALFARLSRDNGEAVAPEMTGSF